MPSEEIHALSYSSVSAELSFSNASNRIWRLESLPLIPELLVPSLVLLLTSIGFTCVASYLLMLKNLPDLTATAGVLGLTIVLVMLTIGAISQLIALSRGGNQPILLDVSPSCIRVLLPREKPNEMVFHPASTLSVTLRTSGFTLALRKRYVLLIETRETEELFWGDLKMFYFWSKDPGILLSLRQCFRQAGYNDNVTLAKMLKAASHSPAAKSLDTPEV